MTSENTGRGQSQPQQDRAQQTYERFLDAAGELLAEVGVEAISTNMISARAGMSPPALYRYFKDKYAVIEALAKRLLARRAAVVEQWARTQAPLGVDAMASNVEPLLRALAQVTAEQPGAIWVFRALRAIPRLVEVRAESRRQVAALLSDVYAVMMPQVPRKVLWARTRVVVEFSYAVEEMIAYTVEEQEAGDDGEDLDAIFYEAGRMLGSLFYFEENPRR